MSSNPKAQKDCPACNKRRIRCDRGLPGCQKCTKKGLQCPGYGVQLKWAGGVAARGRFKGQFMPEVGPSLHTPPERGWLQTVSLQNITDDFMQSCIEYWSDNIASLMVWIDSKDTLYRLDVANLAYSHPVVGLAVVAVSAHHNKDLGQDRSLSISAQAEAVQMIRDQIRQVTAGTTDGLKLDTALQPETVEWILASMLILSCFEMFHSGISNADFHHLAARSLVNTIDSSSGNARALYRFLRNQLAIYEVFACSTSFDVEGIANAIVPHPDDTQTPFALYLHNLHDVTLQSRLSINNAASTESESERLFVTYRAQFEVARGETLMASSKLLKDVDWKRRDFIRLTNIYHNAAILYCARYLGHQDDQLIQNTVTDLFTQVTAMERVKYWVHNLAWPIFIAGTESRHNQERQTTVTTLYNIILEKMGFQHFHGTIEFLKDLWSGHESDWRILAAQAEASGTRIVAV